MRSRWRSRFHRKAATWRSTPRVVTSGALTTPVLTRYERMKPPPGRGTRQCSLWTDGALSTHLTLGSWHVSALRASPSTALQGPCAVLAPLHAVSACVG